MQKSVSRRKFISQLGASAIVGGLVAPSAIHARLKLIDNEPEGWGDTEDQYYNNPLGSEDNPDSAHLFRRGRGWKVLPNGLDDHDNLEWVLRNTDKGGVVRLVSGTYKIGRPVIVPDFDGTLRGAGAAHTTVTCTDEFSYEIWEAPGGGKELGEPSRRRSPVRTWTDRRPAQRQLCSRSTKPRCNPASTPMTAPTGSKSKIFAAAVP